MLEPPACATIPTMTVITIPSPKPTPMAAGALHGGHGGSSGRRASVSTCGS
jgi:hypothetical protein